MRIAFFTETFLPKIDGVVTRLTQTLNHLNPPNENSQNSTNPHDALIFAPHKPPRTYGGFRVVAVPGIPFRPWYPELSLGLPHPVLGRELDRFAPDVVHVVNPFVLGMWGTALAKQRNLPLLASFHTDIPEYTTHHNLQLLRPLSQTWIRDVHNQAHVNLCTSQPMVARAKALGIQRVRLWPKAVDTVRYHPRWASWAMRTKLAGGHPEQPLIVCVGRLSLEKRLGWLEPAIVRLNTLFPRGVRLALVGSGPDAKRLKKTFAHTPTVFTGYLSGDALAAAYASADVFAFPSDTETLGFVAMEAMASGVPVVAANAGGIPDVVQHGHNGLLFDVVESVKSQNAEKRTIDQFTHQLACLIANPTLRHTLGSQARCDALEWDWNAGTRMLVEYYRYAQKLHRRFEMPMR